MWKYVELYTLFLSICEAPVPLILLNEFDGLVGICILIIVSHLIDIMCLFMDYG